MEKTRKLSQHALILITLFKLSNGTKKPVPFEDIVIQAWRDFPEIFSLRGHPEYPDSNNVSKRLYSALTKKGLVISLKSHTVRLTEKGLEEAKRILRASQQFIQYSPLRNLHLTHEERKFLEQAFRSRPLVTWLKGEKASLVDYDARIFLGISTSTTYTERQRRIEVARSAIHKAINAKLVGSKELEALLDYFIEHFPKLLRRE